MLRVVSVSRHVASTSSRPCLRAVRRRLTTEASESTPPKKSNVGKIILTTTLATGTFYVGSAFISYHNKTYREFFVGSVPLGRTIVHYGEKHGWDDLTVGDVATASTEAFAAGYTFVSGLWSPKPSVVETPKTTTEKKIEEVKSAAVKTTKQTEAKVESTAQAAKTQVQKATAPAKKEAEQEIKRAEGKVKDAAEKDGPTIKKIPHTAQYELEELVGRAEAAIAGKIYPPPVSPLRSANGENTTSPTASSPSSKNIYHLPLPLGFEPPPGYTRPSPPKPTTERKSKSSEPQSEPVLLPLVAPAVSDVSEPIITHLASMIDNLASYLKSDSNAAEKVGDILESAKGDLAALVDRMDVAKESERNTLTATLDEQTREYTLKLLEMEMEAQDKLDEQEQGFRKAFEQEKARIIHAYREKLDHELKTQTEIINERLKEEVIAQGIELQRRWIREVKVRVEEERGGRLGKLEELSANLKRLERIALDNSAYLDENLRIHTLWSAIRALTSSTTASPVRKPFRQELRVLRHITAAREDPVVSVVLDSLEKTDVPDIGVEPFADLATWFTAEVAPKVTHVALVPDEDAGVLSYLASRALSSLRFQHQGLVSGNDALSVIARAEYYLNEKNLESAARELNQLTGPAKTLLHDWLEAARKRLEVEQALEIVQTQATLAALLLT